MIYCGYTHKTKGPAGLMGGTMVSVLSTQERRKRVCAALRQAGGPVSATALAERFQVSRQIIVGDVALLRASGEDITATPRGYVWGRSGAGITRTVACLHAPEEMGRELYAIVDAGSEVVDVVVEHPVYGQIAGALRLRTRGDVAEFLRRVELHGAKPLSDLTGGIHLHTVRCPDEAAWQRTVKALGERGFLLNM